MLVGGLLQVAVQLPQLRTLRAVGRPALGWSDPAVRSVLLLMSPRLLAYGINSVNTVVSTRFAASLGDSSVSHLYYANRLKELVLGGFAVSVATAILPTLSKQALAEDRGPFKDHLAFALRLIAFVTLPATVGLVALQVPIVRVLFQGGRFGAADTAATAGVLATLALGLFFFAGVRVVVPAFYALKNTTLPVAGGARRRRGLHRCSAPLLTRPLGLPGIGAGGIGCRRGRRRRSCSSRCAGGKGGLRGRAIASSLWRILAASAAMGAFLVGRGAGRSAREPTSAGAARESSSPSSAIATACYWLAAHWLGAPEPAELTRLASRRRAEAAHEGRRPAGLARGGARRRPDGRRDRPRIPGPPRRRDRATLRTTADEAARKIAGLRVFDDADGKMNLALADVGGAVLAVSQFTLAADLSRGRRPGFERALRGPEAEPLYERFVAALRGAGLTVATGVFGASMEVELVNDGPATFLLELSRRRGAPSRRSGSASARSRPERPRRRAGR